MKLYALFMRINLFKIKGHSSPGGDLSDEDICGGFSTNGGSGNLGFESLCISGGHMEFPQAQQQQQHHYTRSRSGSWTSRRLVYCYY